ncbi:MAG: hypothetical protein ACE5FU_06080, partial [Nitrospinota bacterium]
MRNILFGFFLTGTVLVFSLVLGAEFFLQSYLPESSILSQVQSSGYLSTFPLVVEPNKGIWHSIGWAGSTSMIVMLLYSVRKRFRVFHTFGNLYTWLNIHIFLGVVGPVLVTFHTTFKLGGLVSVSFWCMILVAASGFLGRYIFLKIPR